MGSERRRGHLGDGTSDAFQRCNGQADVLARVRVVQKSHPGGLSHLSRRGGEVFGADPVGDQRGLSAIPGLHRAGQPAGHHELVVVLPIDGVHTVAKCDLEILKPLDEMHVGAFLRGKPIGPFGRRPPGRHDHVCVGQMVWVDRPMLVQLNHRQVETGEMSALRGKRDHSGKPQPSLEAQSLSDQRRPGKAHHERHLMT